MVDFEFEASKLTILVIVHKGKRNKVVSYRSVYASVQHLPPFV